MKNNSLKKRILTSLKIWILSVIIGSIAFLILTGNSMWYLPAMFVASSFYSLFFVPLFIFSYGQIQKLNTNKKMKVFIFSITGIICAYISISTYVLFYIYSNMRGNVTNLLNIFTNPYFAAIVVSILLVNWKGKLFTDSKSGDNN